MPPELLSKSARLDEAKRIADPDPQPNPFDEHTRMWEDEIRGMGLNPDHVRKIAAEAKPYIDHGDDPRDGGARPYRPRKERFRRFLAKPRKQLQGPSTGPSVCKTLCPGSQAGRGVTS